MLKGINPLLNADVLHVLRAMGHGDDLIIADTNFPSDSVARQTVYGRLLRIDASAEVVDDPKSILPVMSEVQGKVSEVNGPNPMLPIERFAFYDRAKKAYAVIQTGERRFYGCFAFRKGVIGPDGE